MARGEAAEILQPAEVAFDHGAVRGGLSAMPDARLAVGFSSDDGAFLGFLRTTRNASVSWPPEQTASNALDARRAGEEIGQKVFDARDEADALFGQMPRSLHRAKRL
jgi:hypothetical protein